MIVDPTADRWQVLRSLWAQLPYYVPSIMLIAFGHTLWLPGSTFDSSPSFVGLARMATEDTWGHVLMAVGFAHLILTAFGPRWLALLVLGGVLFCLTLIAYLLYDASTAPSTGVRAYLIYVVLGVWSLSHWDVKWRRM